MDRKSEMTDDFNKVSEEDINPKQDTISDISSKNIGIDDEIPF